MVSLSINRSINWASREEPRAAYSTARDAPRASASSPVGERQSGPLGGRRPMSARPTRIALRGAGGLVPSQLQPERSLFFFYGVCRIGTLALMTGYCTSDRARSLLGVGLYPGSSRFWPPFYSD